MTVCPPADTSTNLNNGLVNIGKDSLDKDARDGLVKLSAEMMEDDEDVDFGKVLDEIKSMKEKNVWKNWYLVYSAILLPYSDFGRKYDIFTTATSG